LGILGFEWSECDTNMLDTFELGQLYSNEEIYTSLGVGNAGGVRADILEDGSLRRLVIMTSAPDARQLAENPYHDRIEGDFLIYTGAGRLGNQNLSGINARIVQQPIGNFPIYGFILLNSRRNVKVGPRRWAFLGLLEYMRHYSENQKDSNSAARQTWMFELRIFHIPAKISVAADALIMQELLSTSRPDVALGSDDREVVGVLKHGISVPEVEQQAIESVRARLLRYDPRQFEFVLKELLSQSGFERIAVTKYSQDGGIDVNAYPGVSCWPIRSLLVQIQAKRWLHTVGRKEIAELRGSLMPHARGCIVTTSHYSKAAITESTAGGKVPIALIDGYELSSIVRTLDLSLP
jgi:HJR/Mrr/RecB family endonuclease